MTLRAIRSHLVWHCLPKGMRTAPDRVASEPAAAIRGDDGQPGRDRDWDDEDLDGDGAAVDPPFGGDADPGLLMEDQHFPPRDADALFHMARSGGADKRLAGQGRGELSRLGKWRFLTRLGGAGEHRTDDADKEADYVAEVVR
jgi:hypothetical protein